MKRFALPILFALIVAAAYYDYVVAPGLDNLPPQTSPPVAQTEPAQAKETLEILDFFATWCGPCKMQMPKMLLIEADGYDVTRVNVDDDEARAKEYNIHSVPTYVVLINGKEKYRTQNAWELADWLKNHERSVSKDKVRDLPKATREGKAGQGTQGSKDGSTRTLTGEVELHRPTSGAALETCPVRDGHLHLND